MFLNLLKQNVLVIEKTMFQDGATPLFKAAHKGHVEVVHELLPYKPCLGLLRVRFSGFSCHKATCVVV